MEKLKTKIQEAVMFPGVPCQTPPTKRKAKKKREHM